MSESKREIEMLEMGKELSVCPSCGYENGFHNMFKKEPYGGNIKWLLICPQCGSTFNIGLSVPKN